MSSGMTSLLSLKSVCYDNQQLREKVANHLQEKESSEFSCLCEVTQLQWGKRRVRTQSWGCEDKSSGMEKASLLMSPPVTSLPCSASGAPFVSVPEFPGLR